MTNNTPCYDTDEHGSYVELCFGPHMAKAILDDDIEMQERDIVTLRVYHSVAAKRAVVVKDDDLLTKKELALHAAEVAKAILQELTTWFDNDCFLKALLKNAKNIMTSRYVSKWKWIKLPDGTWVKIIRMRLVLRGFMDTEASSLDTFAGTAKRTSQRILASEAAVHEDWILASLDG